MEVAAVHDAYHDGIGKPSQQASPQGCSQGHLKEQDAAGQGQGQAGGQATGGSDEVWYDFSRQLGFSKRNSIPSN
jgi:hypothetical protein